jgi:hypothetical protein
VRLKSIIYQSLLLFRTTAYLAEKHYLNTSFIVVGLTRPGLYSYTLTGTHI